MEESLLKAAATNDIRLLKFCLENNISVNSTNMNGLTALHVACKEGNDEIVEELVSVGANLNAKTNMGNTALHIAALLGYEKISEFLIQKGANINAQTNRGFTPLYMAAQQNHIQVARALLSAGADPYLLADEKYAPLAVASQQGHTELMEMLLTHEQVLEGCEQLPKLHVAVKKEDLDIIESLLSFNADVDQLGPEGTSALCTAINYGCYKAAVCLLNNGANVNIVMKNNNRPLHFAAKSGRYRFVMLLIARGAEINVRNKSGIYPLHCAVNGGHQQILEFLLENGADPKISTVNGLSPLHCACQKNQDGCARLLIAAGANLEAKTKNGLTALHIAAHYGNSVIIMQLINRNADFRAKTTNGFTPLHVACSRPSFNAVMELIPYGMVNEPDLDGWTPLQTACYMGNVEIVRLLCGSQGDLSLVNKQGMGPIHFAAANGSVPLIEFLIKQKCDVNLCAKNGETPLLLAVYSANIPATELLIKNGGDCTISSKKSYNVHHMACKHNHVALISLLHDSLVKARGSDDNIKQNTFKGFAPIHVACKYGNSSVVQYLLSFGDFVDRIAKRNLTPLLVATHYGNLDVVQVLLNHNAHLGQTAKNGFTALHISILYDHFDIAELLLSRGALADTLSNSGFAPMHISASRSSVEGVTILLKYNAHHSPCSNEGITPMHCCAKEDCVDCAQLLYESGSSLDDQNKGGYTPLLIACYYGSLNMIIFLLQNNANVNLQTKIGYTALHQAAQQGSPQIVSLLLEHGADPNILCYGDQTAMDIANLFDHQDIVDILAAQTSVETSGPIPKDKRLLGEPLGVENLFVDSEEETSDAHTLGRLLPKHIFSTRPILHSFDAVSTTIGDEKKLELTNAPLVSTFSIFETKTCYMNFYDSILNHNNKSQILAFDCHGNPHFHSNYYSTLLISDIIELIPPNNSNISYNHNGIPLIEENEFSLSYNNDKILIASSEKASFYVFDDVEFKQIMKPNVRIKQRGDGCYTIEDKRLFFDSRGFPLLDGSGTIVSDKQRNLFYLEKQLRPLYSGTFQLKREPMEILTTFDHNGIPLLGFIPLFTQNGENSSLMLNKNGIPLFSDIHCQQLYFDDEDRLVTVNETVVKTESPVMNTVAEITAITEKTILVKSNYYDSIQYNYYGFPILFGDQRQDEVDYDENGLFHLNSKIICHSSTKKPLFYPLSSANCLFDCLGVPLPSSNVSLYRKCKLSNDSVSLCCDGLTGNLIFLPNGIPMADCDLYYGGDDFLYCGGKPVLDKNNKHIKNMAAKIEFREDFFVVLSDNVYYDCFGMPLVSFGEKSSFCLVFNSDGRVCVVDGCNIGKEWFLCFTGGKYVTRCSNIGKVVINHSGDLSYLYNYDTRIESGDNCCTLKYSSLIFDDNSLPIVTNSDSTVMKYHDGLLHYNNLPVINEDSTQFKHPGTFLRKDGGVSYLSPSCSYNWRGIPIISEETRGCLLRNEDYTLNFVDGVHSSPLCWDFGNVRVTAVDPPGTSDCYYTSKGELCEGTVKPVPLLRRNKTNYLNKDQCLYMPSGIPYTDSQDILFYRDDTLWCFSATDGKISQVYTAESEVFVDPRATVCDELVVVPGHEGIIYDVNGLPLLKPSSNKIESLPSGLFVSTSTPIPRILINQETGKPLNRNPTDQVDQVDSIPPPRVVEPVVHIPITPIQYLPKSNSIDPQEPTAKFRVSFMLDASPKVIQNTKLRNLRIQVDTNTVIRPTRVNITFSHPSTIRLPELSDGEYFANKILTINTNRNSFIRPLVLDVPFTTSPTSSRELYILAEIGDTWSHLPFEQREHVLRVSLDYFPVTLAIISRPKTEIYHVTPSGETITLSNCHVHIPANSLNNPADVSIQTINIDQSLIGDCLGGDAFVSPILVIKLNAEFRQNVRLKLPLHGMGNNDVLFKYGHNIRIFSSSNYLSSSWEDVTFSTDVVLQAGGDVAFTVTKAAKFWVVASVDSVKLSNLYKRVLTVDYSARFVVYLLKGRNITLMCLCVTDSVDLSYMNQYEPLIMTDYIDLPGDDLLYVGVSGGGCYSVRPLESCCIRFDPFFPNLLELVVGSTGMTTVTLFSRFKTFVKECVVVPAGDLCEDDSCDSVELVTMAMSDLTTEEIVIESEVTIGRD